MFIRPKRPLKPLVSIALVITAVGVFWIVLLCLGLKPQELHRKIAALDAMLVFLLMILLPIFGFSIGIIYVVAGAKFGSGLGLVLVSVSTAIHLAGSYWIARSFLRNRLEAILNRRNYHLPNLPETEQAPAAFLTALVPGLPYAARNYLLGLAGIPFRTCLIVCLPVYVIRSSVAILFGELSGTLTYTQAAFLGTFFCLKVAISAYLIKRLRDKWLTKESTTARDR